MVIVLLQGLLYNNVLYSIFSRSTPSGQYSMISEGYRVSSMQASATCIWAQGVKAWAPACSRYDEPRSMLRCTRIGLTAVPRQCGCQRLEVHVWSAVAGRVKPTSVTGCDGTCAQWPALLAQPHAHAGTSTGATKHEQVPQLQAAV